MARSTKVYRVQTRELPCLPAFRWRILNSLSRFVPQKEKFDSIFSEGEITTCISRGTSILLPSCSRMIRVHLNQGHRIGGYFSLLYQGLII